MIIKIPISRNPVMAPAIPHRIPDPPFSFAITAQANPESRERVKIAAIALKSAYSGRAPSKIAT
jgi:hypothetical protein